MRRRASGFAGAAPCPVTPDERALYLTQAECASVGPTDVAVLGSGDATTCVLVFLHNAMTGSAGCAHVDAGSSLVTASLADLAARVAGLPPLPPPGTPTPTSAQPTVRLVVHLVGGYDDERGTSLTILHPLLAFLTAPPPGLAVTFELGVACIHAFNTRLASPHPNAPRAPRVYEAGLEPRSGDVFPADFHDRGPEQPLRASRFSARPPGLWDTWDRRRRAIVVSPFTLTYRPAAPAALLGLSDAELLQKCSTSPDAEPPHFCARLRDAQRLLVALGGDVSKHFTAPGETHPRALVYRHDAIEGEWMRALGEDADRDGDVGEGDEGDDAPPTGEARALEAAAR